MKVPTTWLTFGQLSAGLAFWVDAARIAGVRAP
jgi:hypothetical protein